MFAYTSKTEGFSCQPTTVNLSITNHVIYLALLKKYLEVPRERIVVVVWNQEICKSLRDGNKFDPGNAVMEQQ